MKCLSVLLLATVTAAFAVAPNTVRPWEIRLRGYFEATDVSAQADLLKDLVSPQVALTAHRQVLQALPIEKHLRARNDRDLGASVQPQGSTALVSIAGVTNAISTAVESGALTQSNSGTGSTIRIKPIAAYDLFANRPQTPCQFYLVLTAGPNGEQCATLLDKFFGGLSMSVTLDNAKPDKTEAQPVAAVDASGKTTAVSTANGSVLSLLTQRRGVASWGARYEIYTKRSERNPAFIKAWNRALANGDLKTKGDELGKAVNALSESVENDPKFKAWHDATRLRLSAARSVGWGALQQAWLEQLLAFDDLGISNSDAGKKLFTAQSDFLTAENAVLKAEFEKPMVSFEYTNLRPLNQPSLSNFKLLVSKPMNTTKPQEGLFTFNVGSDIYNSIPAGAKVGRLRDVSAALQWDVPVGEIRPDTPAIFTLAAYYQYQITNGLVSIGSGDLVPNTSIQLPAAAATLLTPKGGIFIGQAKLTFKMGDGKTKVPFGVTWSNRTELIKAHEVRGQIGLEFDWGSLVNKSN